MSLGDQLPPTWMISTLGDQLIRSNERMNPQLTPEQKVFYIGLENIEKHTGRILGAAIVPCGEIRSAKNIFHADDILYGKLRPNLNKVYLAETEGICSTDIWVFKTTPIVIPAYGAYYLRSSSVLPRVTQLASGTLLPRISASDFDVIPFPIPTILEQQQIVSILSKADKLRHIAREALEKTRELYQSLFFQLFGTGAPSEKHPKTIKLHELLKVPLANGFSPNANNSPPGIPVFSLRAITDFGLDEDQIKYYPVESYQGRGSDLEIDDILITRSNTLELVGKAARYRGTPSQVIYPDLTIRIRLNNTEDSPYVENYLRSDFMSAVIKKLARGTSGSMKKISQGDINELDVLWPSDDERLKYSNVVRKLDQQQRDLEVRITKLDILFQALLDKAFSGQLTDSWLKKHAAELKNAVGQRNLFLKSARTITPLSQISIFSLHKKRRPQLFMSLSRKQKRLLESIQKTTNYFTPDNFAEEERLLTWEPNSPTEGEFNFPLSSVRRELQLYAQIGLIKPLSLPDNASGKTIYITTYRHLLPEDNSKEEDLRLLEEAIL